MYAEFTDPNKGEDGMVGSHAEAAPIRSQAKVDSEAPEGQELEIESTECSGVQRMRKA